MDCQEVGKFLQVYMDGELDEHDSQQLGEHLAGCSACSALADQERRFLQAVRSRLPKVQAPQALRERLVKKIAQDPARTFSPRKLIWASVPALMAATLVFTWTVSTGFSLVDEAVNTHSAAPPVELSTTEAEQAEGWFKEKVAFNVALPRFNEPRMTMVGARLSHLAQNNAALVRYKRGPQSFSLFVVTDSPGDLEGDRCQRVKARTYCLGERRGYSVVMWRTRGLTYSLVGDGSSEELLRVVSTSPSF